MRILAFAWMAFFIFSGPVFADTVQGSVRFVDLMQKSVTIVPKNSERAGVDQIYLKTENAKLKGIAWIGELEIGDQIIAEGHKIDDGKMDVTDLRLTSKSNDSIFSDRKAAGIPENSGVYNSRNVYAESTDSHARYNAGQKLVRGLLNIVSSPVEIVRSIQTTSNQESMTYGWTVGLLLGIGDSAMRLGTGLFDVVTFPFSFPKQNKGPIIEPEFVWEKPGVKYI